MPQDPIISDVLLLALSTGPAQVRQPFLGLGDIISQDIIDIVVGLSSLIDYVLFHLLFQEDLKLLLLLYGQVMSICEKLLELVVC